ncbi:MAG: exodeoxyribonuclease V subunit alpha, partial [bacterium]|nr:exodeoxyribonuclease V subunit alpha [bacterium]
CAPTGKAAARLKEVVEEHADRTDSRIVRERLDSVENSTIHRLLGFSRERGRFAHHERNPLPHDLVVVDEMSMVSLPLAAKLMSAVRADASLVLAGDPYQLESIEAGTVLSDIVGPAGDPSAAEESVAPASIAGRVVVLERVHRFEEQGSIADFAGAVRDGVPDRAVVLLDRDPDALHWVRNRSGGSFRGLAERVFDHRVRLVEKASQPGNEEAALAELGSLAVLCAHREGPGSVEQWRRDIEGALDGRFPGLRYGGEWYPGRPLMITANDYNLGLYNGDIGVVAQTDDGLRVVFERGGLRMFPPGYLGDHATVHALTIHKSQGSQFGEVVVSLPSESSRLLTRELLYTAVTRASRRVTVVGEEPVIRMAVERSVQRASGLSSRLWTRVTS